MPILGAYKAVDLAQEYGESLPAGLAESLNLPLTEDAAEARYEELHNWGSERLESTIQELKGFYVKTGQVISTRVDLFPEQYTSRLASLQDDLDPMPTETVHAPRAKGRWPFEIITTVLHFEYFSDFRFPISNVIIRVRK